MKYQDRCELNMEESDKMKKQMKNRSVKPHTPKRNWLATMATALLIATGIIPLAAEISAEPKSDKLPGLGLQPAEYFYTGKPYDADTETYTFKYRSYDPELNRWTTADPSGFPDGANNQIYVNNPLSLLDPNGLTWTALDYVYHFVTGGGAVTLSTIGHLEGVKAAARSSGGGVTRFGDQIAGTAEEMFKPYDGQFHDSFIKSYDFSGVSWPLGGGTLTGYYTGNMTSTPNPPPGEGGLYNYEGIATISYSDVFSDPYDIIERLYGSSTSLDAPEWLRIAANGIWVPGVPWYIPGTPYNISDMWTESYYGNGVYE